MTLGVQPSCSMSVMAPQRATFCSSCDSVSSEANGRTCTQTCNHRVLQQTQRPEPITSG